MARILVHSATGPDDPTRAALALLIAKTAANEGHEVQVFLAGDGVHLANPETAEATSGLGTGSVAEHLADLRNAGLTVFLPECRARRAESTAARASSSRLLRSS